MFSIRFIRISLTDGAWGMITGNVTVNITGPNSTVFNITVVNGTWIKQNISGLPLGDYNVSVYFKGDLNHTGSRDWVTFTVLPYMDLNVTKVVNITADVVNVSDVIKYTINVTNHGPSNATGVNVTEELSPYLRMISNETDYGYYNLTNGTWFIGDLEVGETATLTIIAEVIHSGLIANTVWVHGEGFDTNLTNDVSSAHNFTAYDLIDLNITKWVNVTADIINVLDELQFNITVFNHGPSNATGVYVREALDPHLMIISNYTSDGSIYSGDTWQIGNLANGTNVTLTIIAKVVYSGNFSNNVTVYGFENETDYTNNFDSVKNFTAIANVDVGIKKTVNVTGFVNVTDYIQFNITVYNNGPCNVSGVYVEEQLDSHLELISYTTTAENSTYDGTTWVIGQVNVGNPVNLTIIAKVISNGTIANEVRVTSIDNDTNTSNNNDSIENITALPIVDLEITKEVTYGESVVNVSDEVEFTITVTNHGPCTATDVNVTEELSKHLQLINNYTNGYGYYDVTEGIWHIGDLTNSSTAVLTLRCKVISNGTIANFVVVASNENDTNTSNNNDTIDNITALPIVDLGITKTANVTTEYVNVTEIIEYTITVHNWGPSNATQVNVTEVLDTQYLRLIENNTVNGYYNVTEGIWHIGNLANGTSAVLTLLCEVIGNGTIENTVTVTSYENDTYIYNNTAELTIISRPIVDLRIVKEVNVTASEIDVMDIIKFNVTVYNDGPCNATGVYVREPLSPLLTLIDYTTTDGSEYINDYTWVIGNLANGTNVTLTIVARVSYSGNITNFVEVFGDQPDPDRSNNVDNITNITAYAHADVGINKTVNVTGFVNVTDYIQFNITVYNNGPCNASGVVVTEPLDLYHLELISYNTTNNSPYDGHYTWLVGNVNVGETVNMTIIAKVKDVGVFNNFVSVTCYDNDTNTSNDNWTTDNITALPIVDLEIVKTVVGGADIVYVPGHVQFQINVTNHGPSPATNVNVTEVLDTTYLKYLTSSTNGYGYYNDTEGIWYLQTELPANESAVLWIACELKTNGTITNFVSVNSTENDTNTSNNNDTLTITSIHAVDLFITKAAYTISNSTTIYVGEDIRYEIYVQNNGPCNATNVVVNETLSELVELTGDRFVASAGTTYNPDTGLWTIGDLNVLEYATLTIWVKAKLNGTVSNIVIVNSTESESNPDDNNASSVNITVLPVVDLSIIKYSNVTGLVFVNDYVNFTINVTNNGPSNATNVNVTDRLPAGLEFVDAGGNVTGTRTTVDGVDIITWTIPQLNNASVASLWVVVKVNTNGTFINVASVNSTENDTIKENETEINTNPVTKFTVIKTSNWTNNICQVNDLVKFTITITNNGPSNATNVNVSDVLDANFEFNSTDGDYNRAGHKIFWNLGDMDVGDTREVWVIVKVKTNGTFTNIAAVNSTENKTGTENGTDITVNPVNILTLIKYANVTQNIMVNDYVNFTINVTNHGPSNATNVNITDKLPVGFEFITASERGVKSVVDGVEVVTWNIGDLDNGGKASVWVVVKVNTNGTFRNVATVNSTENTTGGENGTDIDVNPVNNLTLVKSSNWTNNIGHVNDLVNFTITVTNNGPSNATNVNITDVLNSNFEFNSTDGYYDRTNHKIVWYLGDMINGASREVWVVVKVKANGTFTNIATVNSTENTTGGENGTDINVDPVNNLTLIKYANVTENIMANDLVKFTINVTNNGPSTATNVNVTDVLDVNFEYIGSNGRYDSNTRTVTWNVGTLPNEGNASVWVTVRVKNNGTFRNVATVNSTENSTVKENETEITVNPVNNFTIIKYANVTSNITVGDLVNFTINVTNNGPSNATNVNITDTLPVGLEVVSTSGSPQIADVDGKVVITWNIGDLNNGTRTSVWVIVRVTEEGKFTNVASVNSTENTTGPSNETTIYTGLNVDLDIIKTVSTKTARYGDVITYTIVVTNHGPDNATDVNVTEKLSSLVRLIGASPSQGTYDTSHNIWHVGTVNNGASARLTLRVQVTSIGTIENWVNVTGNENETDPENNNYTCDNVTATPADSAVWAPDIVEYYGVTVNVPVSSQNAIYVYYYITDSSGNVVGQGNVWPGQSIANLNYDVDVYYVHLTTVTDANHYSASYTSKITILKIPTPVEVETVNITYGEDENITITLPSDRDGTINVTVGDKTFENIPVGNGTIHLIVPDLAGGNYTVNVTYSGDRNHYGNTTTGTFTVARAVPIIQIYVEDIWYKEVEILNVTVNTPGTVNITVYGITIEVPLNESVTTTDVLKAVYGSYDGKATWNLLNLPVGTYPAYAIYNGNENYTSVDTSDVFIVKPLPTTVNVTADDIYVGQKAVIKVEVGPEDLGGYVTITLEGKNYTAKVTNGKAQIVVSGLKAGIKNVTVYNPGNHNYLPSENETTFVVLKILPPINSTTHDIEYGEDEVIIIHLPEDATGTVTIVVDGKSYTAPLIDGKATFKIPGLKVGEYGVDVYYSGDDKYLPTNTTDNFKVNETVVPDNKGHTGIDLTRHATGNPILVLVMILMVCGAVLKRSFKK